MKNYPDISVIVPCLNSKKIIGNLIKSIDKQKYPAKIEIVVTDDGSADGTALYLKSKSASWRTKIRVISFSQNQGSAPALNAAAKSAKYQYILATNDDVVFDKNAFLELAKCAKSQQNVGIVTGKMLDSQGQFAIPGFRINHYLGYHPYDLQNKNKIRDCDWAVGACILIKKSLLEKAGGFDHDYGFYGEDYDLSFQIKRAGLRIIYTPNAVFTHYFRRSSLKKQPYSNLFNHYQSKTRYLLKNCTPLQITTYFLIQFLPVPFYYLLEGKFQKTFAIYAALFSNLQNLKKTLKSRMLAQKLNG